MWTGPGAHRRRAHEPTSVVQGPLDVYRPHVRVRRGTTASRRGADDATRVTSRVRARVTSRARARITPFEIQLSPV
jgi:hypothetical protein